MLEVEKASESVAAGLCASPALKGLSNEHNKDDEATWDRDFDDGYDDSDLELLEHVKGVAWKCACRKMRSHTGI
jgi:hypothetical protein